MVRHRQKVPVGVHRPQSLSCAPCRSLERLEDEHRVAEAVLQEQLQDAIIEEFTEKVDQQLDEETLAELTEALEENLQEILEDVELSDMSEQEMEALEEELRDKT